MKLSTGTLRSRGSAVFMTLVIIMVVGLTLVAYLTWSETQTRLQTRSQFWNSALPLAEAGVEEAMAHLNSSSNRAANGWALSGNVYVKQRSVGDDYFSVSINQNADPTIISSGFVRMPPGNTYISRTVTITCRKQGGSGAGLLAKGKINFSGSSVVDSFDSTAGPYNVLTRKAGAGVLSAAGTADTVHIGTGLVYGKAATGPGGTVTTDSGGSLGDLDWHAGANQGIQPGMTSADVNASFPSNSTPTGAFFTPASGTVGGTNYAYVLDSGSYKLTTFNVGVGGRAIVTGDAELYVTSDFILSGSAYLWVAPGASLKIYLDGKFVVSGTGIVNGTGQASKFSVLGLNKCSLCTYSGSTAFVGTINAPNAAVTISGTAGLYGSITGSTINVSGGAGIHYDEALGAGGRYIVDSWNEWAEL